MGIMVVIDVLEEDLKKHQKEEKMKTHGLKYEEEKGYENHKNYGDTHKRKGHKLLNGKITIKKPGKHEKKGHLKDYYKIEEYKDGYEYGEKKGDEEEYEDGYEYGEKKGDKEEYEEE